mgnify:CR=1 FL=1
MIQAWKDLRFSAKLTLIFFLVLSLISLEVSSAYCFFRCCR